MAYSQVSVLTNSLHQYNADCEQQPDSDESLAIRLEEIFSVYCALATAFNSLFKEYGRYPNALQLKCAAKGRSSVQVKLTDSSLFLDLYFGKKGVTPQRFFVAQELPWPLCLSEGKVADASNLEPTASGALQLVQALPELQVSRRPISEGAPPSKNKIAHSRNETRINNELEAYFATHGQVIGQNELHRLTGTHKNVIRPIWRAFKAKVAETTYVGSKPDKKPHAKIVPLKASGKNLLVGAEYTEKCHAEIDDAVCVMLMRLRHTHALVLVTCNALRDDDAADLLIAESSDAIVSTFAQAVIARYSAHPHTIAVWERQPSEGNNGLLHIHALFALPVTSQYPTQKQVEEIWLAHLPQQTCIAPNGAPIRLRGNEVHIQPCEDFSSLEKLIGYFSKRSKNFAGKTKFARVHADGMRVAPQHWAYISPPLRACAEGALVQYRLPARGRGAAIKLVQEITENVCEGQWREVYNRYKNTNAVTGYRGQFACEDIPSITREIASLAEYALQAPTALPEEEALNFALIKIHPSGLVNLSTSKLPLRRRRPSNVVVPANKGHP